MDRDEIVKWINHYAVDDVLLADGFEEAFIGMCTRCLLYTSPSPRD